MTQVQFPASLAVAFACTTLAVFLFEVIPFWGVNGLLFNIHCTVTPYDLGVTLQLIETSFPHMATDGDTDTVKDTGEDEIIDIY